MKKFVPQRPFVITNKRFYAPIKITNNCPRCNHIMDLDLDDQYLSDPEINKDITIDLCCYDCDIIVKYKAKINFEINVDIEQFKIESMY